MIEACAITIMQNKHDKIRCGVLWPICAILIHLAKTAESGEAAHDFLLPAQKCIAYQLNGATATSELGQSPTIVSRTN